MKNKIKIIYLSLTFVAVVFIFYFLYVKTNTGSTINLANIIINDKSVKVEIADSLDKQIQGLSNRSSLPPDTGMLFVFSKAQIQKFWMKDMNFPLDIIWIDNNKIVNISPNLAPEGAAPANTYSSIYNCNYVLEVNAGFSEKNNIKIGDYVKYNLN
jgi:uncharacterized protein